jgi:hypothetical protein
MSKTIDQLLDELTEIKTGLTLYHDHGTMNWEAFYAGKFFEYNYPNGNQGERHWDTMGDTPQEALQKLYDIVKADPELSQRLTQAKSHVEGGKNAKERPSKDTL